jgi:RNA polymerase sigma factor (sigma-70 family)
MVGQALSVPRSLGTLFDIGVVGNLPDGALLERSTTGHREAAELAFHALVERHGPMVLRVCRRLLHDPNDAEDAFQATFLVLLRRGGSIRDRGSVAAWLHGVAHRVAARAQVDSARRRRIERQGVRPVLGRNDEPERLDLDSLVGREVARLPEKYRQPVVLCYLEGLTHEGAADRLGWPVGTVRGRLARARDLLRSRLTRRGLAVPAVVVAATIGRAATASAMPAALANSTIRAAMHLAAGQAMTAGVVPAVVARLVGGELRTMVFTKLTWITAGLLVTGSVSLGIGLLAADPRPTPRGPAQAPAAAALVQAQANADGAVRKTRAEVMNDLKMFGLAMHNFASPRDKTLPPAAIYKDGKPLLSWRVAILPYLDQQALYNKFHLDEPWDGPHNKSLLDQMPAVYAPTSDGGALGHETHYQVFTGPGTLFSGDEGTKITDVPDGMGWTILVAQAARPVPWTKPEDLPFDAEKPLPAVGGLLDGGFCVGFADGAARFIKLPVDPKVLKALITVNGGEKLSGEEF